MTKNDKHHHPGMQKRVYLVTGLIVMVCIVLLVCAITGTWPFRADRTIQSVSADAKIVQISVGDHIAALTKEGTVTRFRAEGFIGDASGWKDIVSVSAGRGMTIGLLRDGTVESSGKEEGNKNGAYDKSPLDLTGWKNIRAISAGWFHAIGLRQDGTVVADGGDNPDMMACKVSAWTDIVAVSAGAYHSVGLRKDGTVVAAGNTSGEGQVSGWTDIVAIDAGDVYTVGLRKDGTVVGTGLNRSGQIDFSGGDGIAKWSNIIAISSGPRFTAGLKDDGTVVVTGKSFTGGDEIAKWTDIVAVSAGDAIVAGLRKDGTILVAGGILLFDDVPNGILEIGSESTLRTTSK